MDHRNNFFTWLLMFFACIMLSACNSGKGGRQKPISKFRHSAEGKLTQAYQNYLGKLEMLDFPSADQDPNSDRILKSGFFNEDIPKSDLFFFPATLWQIYSVSNSPKWEQEAKLNSNYLRDSYIPFLSEDLNSYENYLHLSYQSTKDRAYLKLLLQVLSASISGSGNDSLSNVINILPIEKLSENQVLFFASKETGDPVYRNFALQNSELIYNNCFLANAEKPGTKGQIDRRLAIGMYEFTYLYKETGMEKYKHLSNILADQFIGVYDQAERGDHSKELETCINGELDLVSQALVSVALYDLGEIQGNHYMEISVHLFQHILATLGQPVGQPEMQPSFQLFYYLFNYQTRLQSAEKEGLVINS